MKLGIHLIGFSQEGLFEALDPEALSTVHPLWRDDVRQLEPWTRSDAGATGHPSRRPLWEPKDAAGETRILVSGRSSSTMDVLHHLMGVLPLAPWDSVLAVEQRQGRGQKHRKWISPPGNIYASWYWPNLAEIEGAKPGWSQMASLLAGDLVAAVLESIDVAVEIKWPNDLLLEGHKLCGILVEQRGGRLIVGVGLNVASIPVHDQLTDPFGIPAACLAAMGVEATPLALWRRIVESGRERLLRLVRHMTPDMFPGILKRRLAWIGRDVTIRKSPEEAFTARIEGIAPDGALIVRRSGTVKVIYTGSILPLDNVARK